MDTTQDTTDVLGIASENFTAQVTDPQKLWLIVGPVAFLLLVLIAILLIKFFRRKQESTLLEQALKEGPKTSEAALENSGAATSISEVDEIRAVDEKHWLVRLGTGLKRTRDSLVQNLSDIFAQNPRLDGQTKERIHETLFRADLGVSATNKLVKNLERDLSDHTTTWDDVKNKLSRYITDILSPVEKNLTLPSNGRPYTILVVGVNGVGKTTTVAKLAANFLAQDKSVLLCAADTFRAAAIDQLKVWGKRLDVDVIAHQQGSVPAAVAFDGVKAALARKKDVLIVDTAGRLHNRQELMDELSKIKRAISKELPNAPDEVWLVVDATTGQNAIQQIKAFKEVVDLTGLIVTKLDGTAKGGVLIAVADQFALPIYFVGVGEKASDLRPFRARDFATSLLG